MIINTNFSSFKKKHKNKKNQIIFHRSNCKNNKIIENIINNFLVKKNSFIFESVEKRRIRGRYTIIGADPDKTWELNGKKIYLIEKNKKKINKSNVEGELVYSGKNVSMGYALNINDLSKGDNNHGILRTGDIAKKDSNNYYYIVGRKDRYVKIFGNRVNLFELEQIIFKLNTKSVCFLNDTNKIDIYVTINKKRNNEIIKLLNKYTDLHSTVFKVINVKSLPLNKNLKISYNFKKYE